MTSNCNPLLSRNCSCCCCGDCCCVARRIWSADIELCSVAVKSSLLPLAIKLSLPCSAFELVSYTNNTGVGQGHPLGYITHGGEYGHIGWFVVTVANFGMLSLKVGYRILNCIMNLLSFIFGFYLSLGIPQLLFKVIFFVAVIILSTHSYLEFICVGCYCTRFLFVGLVHQTLRKLGRCQMTQLL